MNAHNLPKLRAAMARCDESIQRSVARRLRIARRIGEAKRERGLPVRDYAVESAVLARWRAALERVNIAPERAEELARWFVEEAVRLQESLPEPGPLRHVPSDVLVVGGAGAMGGWIARFLQSQGHRVSIYDPRADTSTGLAVSPELAPAVREAEVVVVATPIGSSAGVYREVVDHLRGGLLFDILSIKAPLLEEIQRARELGRRVTSIHPLFGPSTRVLSGRNLLVLDCGDPNAADAAERLFERSSLTISRRPIADHDRLMGDMLGLPHATSLLFSTVLSRAHESASELRGLEPLSFSRQADVARIVTSENSRLSFEIHRRNPESSDLFDRLERALHDIREAAGRPDAESYDDLLTNSRRLWGTVRESRV